MDTEDMTVDQEDTLQQGDFNDENQYSIYNYLKEHTTFLIASVSAAVAVISFLLNYAADQYTVTYLRYWLVDTVYAVNNKTELVYVMLFTLLYVFVMVITHRVMSRTADVFGFYNRIISDIKRKYKKEKKAYRANKRAIKMLSKKYKTMVRKSSSSKAGDLRKEIENKDKKAQKVSGLLKELKSLMRKCEIWISLMVALSCFVMFALNFVFAGVVVSSIGINGVPVSVLLASVIVAVDLLFYIVPAYCSSMINRREHKDLTSKELANEIEKMDKNTFPIATVARRKLKEMMTNKKITQIVGVTLVILMVCAGMCSTIGESHADRKKDFPIFFDETGAYAVVYNNGEVLVLKAAYIEGTTIEINTRQQKIVSCMDVAYEICTFETVVVTGKDGGK